MCGICGIWKRAEQQLSKELLNQITRSILHRGPDSGGVFVDGSLGLGHRRLAIIDLSPTGKQPMQTTDGRFAITYGGEIYNFRELRNELEQLGYRFRGHSDTEVILNGFAQWGSSLFAKLNGMFGLAIWDGRKRELWLARDRFGIKPLFFCEADGNFAFGSEIKAILTADVIPRKLDWQAFHEYLYFGVSLEDRTFFENIRHLNPGHYLRVDADSIQERPYCSLLEFEPCLDDYETATRNVYTLLEESVERHLFSDVPVGAFLSGGIDSASIVAIASRKVTGKLDTFTANFDFDKNADESVNARLIAETFETNHHEMLIKANDIADLLVKLVHCHDVPFGDMANLPLYLLCHKLNGTPKVVLQGDGGDEIFGGYKRYQRIVQRNIFRHLGPLALSFRPLMPRTSAVYRSLNTFYAFCRSQPEHRLAWLLSQERFDSLPEQLFTNDVQRQLRETNAFLAYEKYHEIIGSSHRNEVDEMMLTDCHLLLPNQYFEKVDRPTMAHGIEVRVPMVDIPLTKYVFGLPTDFKVNHTEKKRVLRDAMRGTLPDVILDGPKKGFGVPVDQWFRQPLFEFLNDSLESSAAHEIFDKTALKKCLDDHRAGKANHGTLLFKLLNFCLWVEEYAPSIN